MLKNIILRKKAETEMCLTFVQHLPAGRWVGILYNVKPTSKDLLPTWAIYHDGWNGSFHDAQYEASKVVVVGRSPSRARRRLRYLVREGLVVGNNVDVSVERFQKRNLVRFGD